MWDTELLGANVSTDGIVTLRYREPGFATASIGGAFRSGAFTEEYGYRNLDGLGAERLVVVAPPDTQFERTVPGATVSGDGTRMTLTELDEGGFVTSVPSDTHFGPVLSRLAIGSVLAPAMLLNALIYVALPTAVFALLIGALTEVLSWLEWEGDGIAERAGVAIGAIGAVVTALSVLATGGVSVVGGTAAPLFGAGIALIGFGIVFSRAGIREEGSYSRLVGGAVLGVLLAAGVTVLGAMSVGQSGLTRSVMSDLPFLVPLFMLLPAGYAYGQEKRRLAVGTAAGGFALSMMFVTPFTSPWFGLGLILGFLALIYAVGIAVVGAPLFVIAASYASPLSSR